MRLWLLVPIGVGLLLAGPAEAQADSARRFDRIQAKGDTSQFYALEIPPGYSSDRRWPLLILMDPRGRARIPLDCFSRAASRLGYLVMSSYNTRSDEAVDPNPAAVNAMLADAGRTLAIDERRLYLAGFSGTARVAWMMATELTGSVAGIIGFGAGVPPRPALLPSILRTTDWDPRFSFAGGAGRLDFNHLEMVDLADSLRARRVAHWIRDYPGEHAWPDSTVCTAALWWLHARAMKTGLAPRDSAVAREDRARRRETADRLTMEGDPVGAGAELRAIVDLYDGWLDLGEERAAVERLEHSSEYKTAAKEAVSRARAERKWMTESVESLRAAIRNEPGFDPARTFREIDGPKLALTAQDSTNRAAAESARRRLEWIYVTAGFYQPRTYLERNQPMLAAKFGALAEAVRPLRGEPCRLAYRAHELLGDSTGMDRYRPCVSPR